MGRRKSCFRPISLLWTSFFRDRNKYGWVGRRSINFFKDSSSAIAMRFIDDYFSSFAACNIFISVRRGRRWRRRHRKSRFSLGSSSPNPSLRIGSRSQDRSLPSASERMPWARLIIRKVLGTSKLSMAKRVHSQPSCLNQNLAGIDNLQSYHFI